MFIELIEKEKYEKTIEQTVNKINNLLNVDSIGFDKQFISNKILSTFRNTLGLGLSKIVENIILEHAMKSELLGAYSSDFFFLLLSNLLKTKLNKSLDYDLNKIKNILENIDKSYDFEKEKILINKSVSDTKISSMIIEAINLAGVDGKVVPIKSPKDEYSIELTTGFNFKLSPYLEFLRNDKWSATKPKVCIIDGIIEKESEIHKLLNDTIEAKSSLVLITRGFSEEVIATLAANYVRGILNVLPIRVPFELDSINVIADLCVCCGCDPITPFKGDLVSLQKFSNLKEIEYFEATKSNISIKNKKTKNNTLIHVNDLIKRRSEQKDIDMIELIDKRINCFSFRTVYIRLGKGTDKQKLSEIENIDYSLRIHKTCFEHGIIDYSHFLNECKNIISNDFFDILEKINLDSIPNLSIFSALHYAISCFKLLSSVEIALCQQQ